MSPHPAPGTDPHPSPEHLVPIADGLLPRFAAVRRLVRRLAGQAFEHDVLTGSQLEVLRYVGRHPGAAVAEVATELGLAPNSVSTLVTQLVSRGLVERGTSASDRRTARLHLTAQASAAVDASRRRRQDALVTALADLPTAVVQDIERALPALDLLAERLRDLEAATAPAGESARTGRSA